MQLFAYCLLGNPDQLVVWVGVHEVFPPPSVTLLVDGANTQPNQACPFEPLGDEVLNHQGQLLNHRAIFTLPWPLTQDRFSIEVRAGNQSTTLSCKKPPLKLPDKKSASFNLLLSSCYYQPNDHGYSLAAAIQSIKPAPDLTLLAGDQVYLDLPLFQNLPQQKSALARALGAKYWRNWFSAQQSQPGLAEILRHGPVLCLPDDHEYWNNAPYFQAQLNNTYSSQSRGDWHDIAFNLYSRYQQSPAQAQGFFRLDIDPLLMLFVDGRSYRDARETRLFNPTTVAAIQAWEQDLLDRKQKKNLPAVGLLSSGQALLMKRPNYFSGKLIDQEMVNYSGFEPIEAALTRLFKAGIPVLYITGDVHWGRIVEGRNDQHRPLFYEIIASPSRLIDTPGQDQVDQISHAVRRLFGKANDFPRHSEPEDLPSARVMGLKMRKLTGQKGDHVALIRFNQGDGFIEFSVDYVCTHGSPEVRRRHSVTHGPFKVAVF